MIRVIFFKCLDEIRDGKTYYVDTDSFLDADLAATDKAKQVGVNLDDYPQKALSMVDVLKV